MLQLLRGHHAAWMGFRGRHDGIYGSVFELEILRAGDARGMRGGLIVSAPRLAHPARKLLELLFTLRHTGCGDPGLVTD
jgi:hypothetical protein